MNVEGVRLTYIPAQDRLSEDKNWAGQPVLSVRAYQADGRKVHRGAEIPIASDDAVINLIEAIHALIDMHDRQ